MVRLVCNLRHQCFMNHLYLSFLVLVWRKPYLLYSRTDPVGRNCSHWAIPVDICVQLRIPILDLLTLLSASASAVHYWVKVRFGIIIESFLSLLLHCIYWVIVVLSGGHAFVSIVILEKIERILEWL